MVDGNRITTLNITITMPDTDTHNNVICGTTNPARPSSTARYAAFTYCYKPEQADVNRVTGSDFISLPSER